MKNQLAFTLMEWLLTITISSVLILGLINVYLQFKSNRYVIIALQAVQERARYAYLVLIDAIHTAGSIDCLPASKKLQNHNKIVGYSADTVPRIWHIHALHHTDVIMLSGCYKKNSKLIFLRKIYYLGNTYRLDKLHHPIYALYTKNFLGNRRELIENVQAMRIYYGIFDATKKSILYYSPATKIKKWLQVGAVKMSLLLSHITNKKNQQQYWFEQQLFYPKQRYFYQSLNIYAAIWNR